MHLVENETYEGLMVLEAELGEALDSAIIDVRERVRYIPGDAVALKFLDTYIVVRGVDSVEALLARYHTAGTTVPDQAVEPAQPRPERPSYDEAMDRASDILRGLDRYRDDRTPERQTQWARQAHALVGYAGTVAQVAAIEHAQLVQAEQLDMQRKVAAATGAAEIFELLEAIASPDAQFQDIPRWQIRARKLLRPEG